jgi:hypothetical protein
MKIYLVHQAPYTRKSIRYIDFFPAVLSLPLRPTAQILGGTDGTQWDSQIM